MLGGEIIMTVNEKISKVRSMMQENGINAYIIPSSDPHMGEYVSDHWKTRAFISGFSGSAGTVVITLNNSGLWTDGRYYVQAAAELEGSEVKLFRAAEPDCPTFTQYAYDCLKEGDTVAINGELFSAEAVKNMKALFGKKNISVNTKVDYANDVWEDRPEEDLTEIFYLDEKYCGRSAADKVDDVRKALKEKGACAIVVNKLDNIAWLFNIRANDVAYNPVAVAYAYIDEKNAVFYTAKKRLPKEVEERLNKNGVTVREYDEIFADIAAVSEKSNVLCDTSELNGKLYEVVCENKNLTPVNAADPIFLLKARKNETETANTFTAYLKDGCALAEFYSWIEEELEKGNKFTEYDLTEKLAEIRSMQENNKGESFNAIIAYMENAAMMHYAPKPDTSKVIERHNLLLVDSGGQYFEGTTDTTRTFAMGPISDEERRDFTITLKGVIALSTAVFKKGSTGATLDCLSRVNFWKYGLDYRCGTGHGVGFMLNVHEGPQGFGGGANQTVLEPGMVLTIEPGVYTEGSHGIRTENTVVIREGETTEYGTFYYFEPFTVVPIDIDCIDKSMLTADEINWLNDFHKHVYEKVSPLVSERARKWLEKKTKNI